MPGQMSVDWVAGWCGIRTFTRSINSLLYSSPAEIGNATGLPCSAWISERVGLLDFAGGTTSTRGYR